MDLFSPVRNGDLDKVKLLLHERDIDLDVLNSQNHSVLYAACANGHSEILKLLLSSGANPNIGTSPLTISIIFGYKECINVLLKHGVDVNYVDTVGRSALCIACMQRDFRTVMWLADAGADLSPRCGSNAGSRYSFTRVFFRNARRSELKLIEKLLKNGLQLSPLDQSVLEASRYAFRNGLLGFALRMLALESDENLKQYYSFALYSCAIHNWPDVATVLLDRGVNVNSFADGKTPLYAACREENEEMVKLLLKHGASPNNLPIQCEETSCPLPMEAACTLGNTNIVSLLLAHGASVSSCGGEERDSNLIHLAFTADNLTICQILLEHHVDVDSKNSLGQTVLHRALGVGDVTKVKWLCERNASVVCVDRFKCSALHFACGIFHRNGTGTPNGSDPGLLNDRQQASLVKLLIACKADVNSVDTDGRTPLYLAAHNGFQECCLALLTAGAVQNMKSLLCPLNAACEAGFVNIVKLLLCGSKTTRSKTTNGTMDADSCRTDQLSTALCIALNGRRDDIVDLLLQHGASVCTKCGRDGHVLLCCLVDYLVHRKNDGPPAAKRQKLDPQHRSWILFKKLLATKADDINKSDHTGEHALYKACGHGLMRVAEALIKCGADVNTATAGGKTPLYAACLNGHEDIARLLFDSRAKVVAVRDHNCNIEQLIVAAVRGGSLPIVRLLLGHLKIDAVTTRNYVPGQNATPDQTAIQAALSEACRSGLVDVVKALIPVTSLISQDNLAAALENGRVEILELLIGQEPDKMSVITSSSSLLCTACHQGNLALLTILLNRVVSVSNSGSRHETPLHRILETPSTSVTPQHLAIVDLLLERKVDVNSVDANDVTPLYLTCKLGIKDVVKKLLDCGAKTELVQYVKCPLLAACEAGHFDIVALLLDRLSWKTPTALSRSLRMAARQANDDICMLLLRHGADAGLHDPTDGNTALHCAVLGLKMHGSKSDNVVRTLLMTTADIDALNNDGKTPLCLACSFGTAALAIVRILLSSGADPDKIPGAALLAAASKGSIALLRLLIAYGANVNCRDKRQKSALHHTISTCRPCRKPGKSGEMIQTGTVAKEHSIGLRADSCPEIKHHHMSAIRWLVLLDCDTTAVDVQCSTPLYLAAHKQIYCVVKLLLECGADPNFGVRHAFPLRTAVPEDRIRMLRLLLDFGASANVNPRFEGLEDYVIYIPLLVASAMSFVPVAKALLNNGADINIRDSCGKTALHFAVEKNDEGYMAIMLMNHGADPNLLSNDGVSPMLLACCSGRLDLVELFLAHGADVNQNAALVRPVMAACRKDYSDVLKLLLCSGADPNLPSSFRKTGTVFDTLFEYDLPYFFSCRADEVIDVFPLCVAAVHGNSKLVEMLLDHGADVNVVDGRGTTPLLAATRKLRRLSASHRKSPECIDLCKTFSILLTRGANANVLDPNGTIPLVLIAETKLSKPLEQLLSSGADPNLMGPNLFSPLCAACSDPGCRTNVQLLLKCGALVNPKQGLPTGTDTVGSNLPLTCAVFYGHAGRVKLLLEVGAEVNAVDVDGYTALHRACQNLIGVVLCDDDDHNNFEMLDLKDFNAVVRCLQMLLENGADVNTRSPDGRSPLGIILYDLFNYLDEHTLVHRSRVLCINKGIQLLMLHGARIDDSACNLAGPAQPISINDFFIIDSLCRCFVAELLKAGAGFQILSRYCKAMHNAVYHLPYGESRLCQTVVLAGCAVSPTAISDLRSLNVISRFPSPDDSAEVFLALMEKGKLLHFLEEFQSRPQSLRSHCRLAIRRRLSVAGGNRDITRPLAALNLPEPLKQYLVFEGRLSEVDLSLLETPSNSDDDDEDDDDDDDSTGDYEN